MFFLFFFRLPAAANRFLNFICQIDMFSGFVSSFLMFDDFSPDIRRPQVGRKSTCVPLSHFPSRLLADFWLLQVGEN